MTTRFRFLLATVLLHACSSAPKTTVHVQGTVTSIGYAAPVKAAEVTVQWPFGLGSGTSMLKTDSAGHFVAERKVRTEAPDCEGLVITVHAEGFASAYHQSHERCDKGIMTADFKLFPIAR